MGPAFLDTTGRGIFARDDAGRLVTLVLPDFATDGPGLELPAAALWRTDPGLARGIDGLIERWRDLKASGQLAVNHARLRVRQAQAVAELMKAAQEGLSPALFRAAIEQAEEAGVPLPPAALRAVRAVERLHDQALQVAEQAAFNPADLVPGWVNTLGRIALIAGGAYAAGKVYRAWRGRR